MTTEVKRKIPILVVEDEDLLRSNIIFSLEREGKYEVVEASSAEEAVEILKHKDFALIITDIRLEKMSGVELLSHVSENYPNTKVIVMTAFGSESQRFEVFGRGGLRYLEKPFSLDFLVRTIDEVLENMFNSGFKTILESITLVDLIQLYCLNRATGLIETRAFNKTGEIYISDGRFVHARVGDITGNEALLEMLEWEGGSCTFKRDIHPPVITIPNLNAEQVLLDCLRILDERKKELLGEKEKNIFTEITKKIEKEESAYPISSEELKKIKSILNKISENIEVDESCIIVSPSLGVNKEGKECKKNFIKESTIAAKRIAEILCREEPDICEFSFSGKGKINILRLKYGYLACLTSKNLQVKDLIKILKS